MSSGCLDFTREFTVDYTENRQEKFESFLFFNKKTWIIYLIKSFKQKKKIFRKINRTHPESFKTMSHLVYHVNGFHQYNISFTEYLSRK